jgi:hypothetical protein
MEVRNASGVIARLTLFRDRYISQVGIAENDPKAFRKDGSDLSAAASNLFACFETELDRLTPGTFFR